VHVAHERCCRAWPDIRHDIAGIPQHVVQWGNNRLPCFLDDEDRQRYLQCLSHALLRFGCRLHAYWPLIPILDSTDNFEIFLIDQLSY